ncbi:hypothetical protein M9H77_06387 [Catharanthus roseus]|uniref:Uncharacterized protein n=1 Tax=Catharanthus roseus TaxID=4058 RepID=A0ACC0BS78_CATRO|nr:hypothetical protein M9H77_06387 [Catharanthus roseus]
MASVVLQEPPSSPSHMAILAKKMQTIILRCMRTRTLRSWRRVCERSRGRGLGDLGSSYQVEPFDSLDIDMPSFSLGLTQPTQSHPPISYTPAPPSLGFSSFQSPHPPSIGSSSFQVPPPPHAVGSSTPHMPISIASSSYLDEHDDEPTDVVTPVQQLRFGYRVGKKTTGFTPSD